MKPHANQDSSTPPRQLPQANAAAPLPTGAGPLASDGKPVVERLEAAASLLGDESIAVRRALSREFLSSGASGSTLLRRATNSSDARVRAHARALLDDLHWEAARRRLLRYTSSDDFDFEAGLWRLCALERPDFDARPYRKALDAMAREVEKRSAGFADPLEMGKVLVDYLGLELGYAGDMESYTSPDNAYLHRTIERKKGLPLTLCAMYSLVAERCGLKTGLVPLPGHLMLRLYGRSQNLIVDPFHGGEARSQESLMKYLSEHGLQFKAVWFRDAKDTALLRRQIANLRNSLMTVGRMDRARRLTDVMDQLDAR